MWYEVIINDVLYDECDNYEDALVIYNNAIQEEINDEFDGDEVAFQDAILMSGCDFKIIQKETVADYRTHKIFL